MTRSELAEIDIKCSSRLIRYLGINKFLRIKHEVSKYFD